MARARELTSVDVGVGVQLVAVHLNGHDNFLERGVAGALTQAVDGAFNLRSAVLDARKRERGGHAQVVVGVNADGDVLDATDVVGKALDAGAEVIGQLVAGGVRNVHDGCASVNGSLNHTFEELLVCSARVLGVELDVLDVLLGILHAVDGALNALVLRDAELLVQVLGRDAQASVDAGTLGGLQCLGSAVDVLVNCARKANDHGVVAGEAANLLHGAEVAGRRDGEASLNDVDVKAQQLLSDNELLLGVHGRAGRLLTVTQGGVEDGDLAGHCYLHWTWAQGLVPDCLGMAA